jgi:hypothetical protein
VNTPFVLVSPSPRGIDDIAAAAHAVQANVAALRVAWAKRTGQPAETHDIRTPAPGAVTRARDLLIDWRLLRDYSVEEVVLRLRQVWGEFCALCWLFPFADPQQPPDFAHLPADQPLRCLGHVQEKLAQVQAGLWRLRHEQRLRHDPDARREAAFQAEYEIALAHPLDVYGRHIADAPDDDVLCCACEYAGMLAALRWATDSRWAWEAPGIMDVTPSPG